ncbi:MAG: hypothetical protein WAO20_01730 [Acidobacteriota bacterium]
MRVFVLWTPWMPTDTHSAASQATRFISDPRVVDFWDLWKWGSRTYSVEFGVPENQSWDMFIFYKPHIVWRDKPPEPTFWMQARGLDVGQAYSQEALEQALQIWWGQ